MVAAQRPSAAHVTGRTRPNDHLGRARRAPLVGRGAGRAGVGAGIGRATPARRRGRVGRGHRALGRASRASPPCVSAHRWDDGPRRRWCACGWAPAASSGSSIRAEPRSPSAHRTRWRSPRPRPSRGAWRATGPRVPTRPTAAVRALPQGCPACWRCDRGPRGSTRCAPAGCARRPTGCGCRSASTSAAPRSCWTSRSRRRAAAARTGSASAPRAPAKASSCAPSCSVWPPPTRPRSSTSCSSTSRAAPRSSASRRCRTSRR